MSGNQNFVCLGVGLKHIIFIGFLDVQSLILSLFGVGNLFVGGTAPLIKNCQDLVQEELFDNEHLNKQIANVGNQGDRFHSHKGLIKCLH